MLPDLGPFASVRGGRISGIGADCRPGLVDAIGNGSPRGPGEGTTMKRIMMVLFGAVMAASLLLPVVTEAGNLHPNSTLVRDSD